MDGGYRKVPSGKFEVSADVFLRKTVLKWFCNRTDIIRWGKASCGIRSYKWFQWMKRFHKIDCHSTRYYWMNQMNFYHSRNYQNDSATIRSDQKCSNLLVDSQFPFCKLVHSRIGGGWISGKYRLPLLFSSYSPSSKNPQISGASPEALGLPPQIPALVFV